MIYGLNAGPGYSNKRSRSSTPPFFPAQPAAAFGNSTRFNPKLRLFPNYNENMSLAKSIVIREQMRVDFRWEGFNVFNRT